MSDTVSCCSCITSIMMAWPRISAAHGCVTALRDRLCAAPKRRGRCQTTGSKCGAVRYKHAPVGRVAR